MFLSFVLGGPIFGVWCCFRLDDAGCRAGEQEAETGDQEVEAGVAGGEEGEAEETGSRSGPLADLPRDELVLWGPQLREFSQVMIFFLVLDS